MSNKYTGYQGFRPYQFKKAETLKPGENKAQRENKFLNTGAAIVMEDSRFNTTTGLATGLTRMSDYTAAHEKPQNPLKAKDQRQPVTTAFVAQSSYNSNYPNYMQELLDLQGNTEADFRRAFEKCDTDKSGYIEPREVRALLREATGKTPNARMVDTFMVFFDTNNDGKVDWTEFVTALSKVEQHMEKSLNTKAPKSNKPEWMRNTNPKVLQGYVPQSSSQMDSQGAANDLFEGTTRGSNHIPGYKGYIAKREPGAPGGRKDKDAQYIIETYNHQPPGYTGKSRGLGRGKMTTSNSRADRLIEEYWDAKRAEGK